MKWKVAILDYWGNVLSWLMRNAKQECMDITFITPSDDQYETLVQETPWNYLLIFEDGMREQISSMIRRLRLPEERIIYALDSNCWAQHIDAAWNLLKPSIRSNALLLLNFQTEQTICDYVTCTVNGLSYIATSKDEVIMPYMRLIGKNYAQDEMKTFHELAHKYYNIDDSSGWFLDLGANIGTSGIYFTKLLAPQLKLLAFEPSKENYNILRTNLLLNHMDDEKAIAVNLGLGASKSTQTMYLFPENPGTNGMYPDNETRSTEEIHIVPLDEYIATSRIPPENVRYIWIDTEGFEAQVLIGARNLLLNYSIPIFMEFNPMIWNKTGYYEKLTNLLQQCYTHFILIQEYQQNPETSPAYPITELWKFQDSTEGLAMLGDIFLLKKDS